MLFFQMQIYEFPKNSIEHGKQRNENKHTYNSHKVSADRNCCKNPNRWKPYRLTHNMRIDQISLYLLQHQKYYNK